MRGARLFILAYTLAFVGCLAPTVPKVAEAPSPASVSEKPDFHLDFTEMRAAADVPQGGALYRDSDGNETPSVAPVTAIEPVKPAVTSGVVQTRLEVPPKSEGSFDDVLRLQKELVARHPASDDEKLRLALLHTTAGNLEEAERIFSTLRSRTSKLIPYVEFYLRRQLGDHKEAGKLLAQFDHEERLVTGFTIERAELVTRVRRFRDYTPAENDRVAPGGDVHLYVEPRNFSLQQSGEKQTFHLKYEWKLVDDRAVEQPVPAWEKASISEREDRITSNGPAVEFYQSFHLPLPANLATGHYRVKVIVTDALSGKSDRVQVPIYVMPVEKPR
jgi:hypothetical protein